MNMPWEGPDWRKEEQKREIRLAANRCGMVLLLMLAIMYLLPSGINLLMMTFREELLQFSSDSVFWNELYSLVCSLLIYAVFVPLLLIFTSSYSGDRVSQYLQFPKISGKTMGKILLMGFGVVYPASYVGNLTYQAIVQLLDNFGISVRSMGVTVDRNILSVAVLVLSVSILAPFFEELLMRGGMVSLVKAHGCWFTAISTGILFGFLHTSFEQVYFAAMMGIYAGFITYKTKSVWPTVLLHIAVNTISAATTILISFTEYDLLLNDLLTNGTASEFLSDGSLPMRLLGAAGIGLISILIWVLAICGLVMLVREIKRHPREFHPREESEQVIRLPEKLKVFFTAPGVLIFLVVSILLSCMNAFWV